MDLVDLIVAVLIGVLILRVALWGVRALATPPEGPDPSDVVPVQVDYRCSVCGTRVTMTHAAGDDPLPPRHCREEMELVSPST